MTCLCGIPLPACAADCDRDGTSERHDARLERLCPDCKAHQPELGDLGTRQDCIECGTTLEVRQHELVMCMPCDDCGEQRAADHVETVNRWGILSDLCDEEHGDCAGLARRMVAREIQQDAYEAHCDDVGDEMRAARMEGGL